MCGASEKPMMISGPAPEFEATAVCWLISSQPTKSTLTSTPVSLLNFAALARKMSSSGCTKRTGRSMRRLAPFSIGSDGAGTSAVLMLEVCALAPVTASAAAEAPSARASRRVISFDMVSLPVFRSRRWLADERILYVMPGSSGHDRDHPAWLGSSHHDRR